MITNSSSGKSTEASGLQDLAEGDVRTDQQPLSDIPVGHEVEGQPTPAENQLAELIGVDWGTTNLRVMRIGNEGQVLDLRQDERGASKLQQSDFASILREVAADWLDEAIPVLVCGMAGSRDGWREIGYRECPVSLSDLKPVDVSTDGLSIAIVAGASMMADGELVDVMRGEETQVMGLSECDETSLIVTPGTHSKWIRCSEGSIISFRSFLTGDLFAAIRAETLLGHEMGEAGGDPAAFEAGVRVALQDRALTAILFSVRTAKLSGRIPPASTADYLSGLLIGSEIAAQNLQPHDPVAILGTSVLGERYAAALAVAGALNVKNTDAVVASAKGLWRIHKANQ